jgi:hypothetical protein
LAADLLEEFHGLCVLDSILSGDKYIKSTLPAYSPFPSSRYRGCHSSGQQLPPVFITDTASANYSALFATADKAKKKASYSSLLSTRASCGLNYGIRQGSRLYRKA